MKPRALGRWLAEFLDGFSGSDEPAAEAPQQPIVVPVDMVRAAVADFLKPMVEAAAEEEPAPTAQQLDLLFDDARPRGQDELAEMTLRRVEQMREEAARKEAAERTGSQVPPVYDPNDPGAGQPWATPHLIREGERTA